MQENISCILAILEENKKIFQYIFIKEVFDMEENEVLVENTELVEYTDEHIDDELEMEEVEEGAEG